MQNNIILQQTIKEINNIQKFYLFYHSSLVTFNPGLENILQNIPNGLNNSKLIISNLTNSPDKPHQRIDVEADELKHYALNDGQDFVFRSSIIYLYSVVENILIYKKFDKTTDECYQTINKDILNHLHMNNENEIFIYILRELRNAFVHDNSIWSTKRAKRLSKIMTEVEDENFSLILKDTEIRVGEKIRFLDTDKFKWMIDKSIEIVEFLRLI